MMITPRVDVLDKYIGHLTDEKAQDLLGVSRDTIRKLKRGHKVSKRILIQIAQQLNVSHVDVITHYEDLN